MADGQNWILGQSNNAESSTGLVRSGDNTDSEVLMVQNEGLSVLAVSFLGTAIEARNGGVAGSGVVASSRNGPGVRGTSGTGPGVRGTSQRGTSEQPGTSLSDGVGVFGEGHNAANGVLGLTAGVDPITGQGGVGVRGISMVTGGLAGVFDGGVRINRGNLIVSGGPGDGNAFVSGTVNAGSIVATSKMFCIDHPLDPATKYLVHSTVESPDMKNIYDGVITLDGQGAATVELPEWFNALNGHLRYQVTSIGAPQPNLHIAAEVVDNRFKIGGGGAGMTVSWQVTGIRKDNWAEAHRNPVEQEKPPEERDRYLHPELYGESEERAILPGHMPGHPRSEAGRQQLEEYERWIEADRADFEALMSRPWEGGPDGTL